MYISTPSAIQLFAFVAAVGLLAGCKSFQYASEEQSAETVEIIDNPLSKDEAFDRVRQWAAEAYNSAQDVIQNENKERGTLTMKGIEIVQRGGSLGASIAIPYSFTVDFRDDKIRLTYNMGNPENGSRLTVSDAEQMNGFYQTQLKYGVINALEEEDDFFSGSGSNQ